MVVNCSIKFENNPKLIFYAGQTLAGTIEVTVDKPVKVQKLSLKIQGNAHCRWTESDSTTDSNGKSQSNDTTFTGNECYLESSTYLISSQAVIQSGKHMYNFMCVIPEQAPTSHEEDKGYVRYTASVVLERPWKFDLKYSVGLTVIRHVDLNTEFPNLGIPLQCEVVKTFNCLFCASKPVIMQVSMPMTGFVAGQTINMLVNVNNPTSTAIDFIEIKFVKKISYTSDFPRTKTITDYRTIHKEICSGSIQNGSKQYEKQLLVPLLPPSTVNRCRVVDISYHMHIKGKVSGCHSSPTVKFPVVIGTIPFREIFNDRNDHQQFLEPSAPSLSDFENFGGPSSVDSRQLPPPTYEEIMKSGGIEINRGENPLHLIGNHTYSPSYPYYNNMPNSIGFTVPTNTKL